VTQHVKHFAGSHTYSNGLSPVQSAVVLQAFELVRSGEGELRRAMLMRAIEALRAALVRHGVGADGEPSPIVPVLIGDERAARLAYQKLWSSGVGVTMVEFPVVESGKARFRLQVMANHSVQDCEAAALAVTSSIHEAYLELTQLVGGSAPSWRNYQRQLRAAS
jgi:glycine C-acetyltransferase/8-amino-7-oxononanoate synthase